MKRIKTMVGGINIAINGNKMRSGTIVSLPGDCYEKTY